MTSKQRLSILLDRWPRACAAQGWNVNDRPMRLRVISEAIGRPISSMSELDNTWDVDAVFSYLGFCTDDVRATVELDHPEIGEARRQKWLIGGLTRKLGRPYVETVMRDKFGHRRVDDLSLPELAQLRDTLNARLCAQRRSARNASLTSEESFPDQVEFLPEPETAVHK